MINRSSRERRKNDEMREKAIVLAQTSYRTASTKTKAHIRKQQFFGSPLNIAIAK